MLLFELAGVTGTLIASIGAKTWKMSGRWRNLRRSIAEDNSIDREHFGLA